MTAAVAEEEESSLIPVAATAVATTAKILTLAAATGCFIPAEEASIPVIPII